MIELFIVLGYDGIKENKKHLRGIWDWITVLID